MARTQTSTSAPLDTATPWLNRIVGDGEDAPENLLSNPWNFRIHEGMQKRTMDKVLRTVGIIQRVIVNTTTGHVIDGHMRIMLALEVGQPTIPVTYVALSEDEERQAILYYHQVGNYAGVDRSVLRSLLGQAQGLDGDPIIARMLGDLAGIAKKDLMLPPEGMENADEPLFGAGGLRQSPQARQDSYQAPESDNRISGRGTVALAEKDYGDERFALSVVLTQADYRRWQAVKGALAIKGDTQALLALLDQFEGEAEG